MQTNHIQTKLSGNKAAANMGSYVPVFWLRKNDMVKLNE